MTGQDKIHFIISQKGIVWDIDLDKYVKSLTTGRVIQRKYIETKVRCSVKTKYKADS